MAYNALGFKTITHIGSLAGAAGTNLSMHAYVTADAAATVETSGYFDEIAARIKTGDQIACSLVVSGTPVRKDYVAVNTAGVITLIAAAA